MMPSMRLLLSPRRSRVTSPATEGHGTHIRAVLSCVRSAIVATLMVSANAAYAVDTAPDVTDLPDLSAIRAQIYSGEFEKATETLLVLTQTVRHADLYNLLGYTHRKLGRNAESARWYREALYFDPTHRPALEYQGELFISLGDLESAEKNLELLRLLCHPTGCEEHTKLKDALAKAGVVPKS